MTKKQLNYIVKLIGADLYDLQTRLPMMEIHSKQYPYFEKMATITKNKIELAKQTLKMLNNKQKNEPQTEKINLSDWLKGETKNE